MKYDFFSAYVEVQLVAPDGTPVRLWHGEVKGLEKYDYQTAKGGNLALVSQVTVEQKLGSYFDLTVALSPNYDDAISLLNSSLIVIGDTNLMVRFGYVGGELLLSPWYTGVILEPDFSLGEEYSITLKAPATTGFAARRAAAVRQFAQVARRDIVTQLAAGSGDVAIPINVDFSQVKGKAELERLDEAIDYEQRGNNNLLAIADILTQSYCTYLLQDDPEKVGSQKLIVVDREYRFSGKVGRRFRLYSPSQASPAAAGVYFGEPQGGVYPITSLSTQSKLIFFPGITRGVLKPSFDESTKEGLAEIEDQENAAPTVNIGPKASPGGQVEAAKQSSGLHPKSTAEKGGGGAVAFLGTGASSLQVAKVGADLFNETINRGVQFEVTTLGVPDLLPGEVVSLEGICQKLDGNYSILSVTHNIGEDGFTTSFECISNTGYLGDSSVAAISPANTQEAASDGKESREAEEQ